MLHLKVDLNIFGRHQPSLVETNAFDEVSWAPCLKNKTFSNDPWAKFNIHSVGTAPSYLLRPTSSACVYKEDIPPSHPWSGDDPRKGLSPTTVRSNAFAKTLFSATFFESVWRFHAIPSTLNVWPVLSIYLRTWKRFGLVGGLAIYSSCFPRRSTLPKSFLHSYPSHGPFPEIDGTSLGP